MTLNHDGNTRSWPPLFGKREIQDIVHGPISLFYPLNKIVDTKEFQRLRDIKQLGVTYLVYPCSTHTRFVHSLGTYWLAFKFVDVLKRDLSLNITCEDHLCVSIAALCHDLGHGPFSHLFDSTFRDTLYNDHKHESLSILLLRRLLNRSEIKSIMESYLGVGEEYDKNITFIEELISSKKLCVFPYVYHGVASRTAKEYDSNGHWLPQGRPLDKAFLFDIVANENDSIDVDKFDYLVRDSFCTGIPIPFNKDSIYRLMENARVLPDPYRGFLRICYSKKVADIVLFVGDSRQMLHNLVYKHHVVSVFEAMIVKALVLAGEHLHYVGDNGVSYSLSNVTQNLEAYLKTTDAVLRDISNSTSPYLADARKILQNVEMRNIPKKVEEMECGPSCVTKILNRVNDGSDRNLEDIQKLICRELTLTLGSDFDDDSVLVLAREMHRGLDGRSHPMKKVLLYDNKCEGDVVPCYVNEEWLRLKAPQEAAIWSVCLYVARSMTKEQRSLARNTFNAVVSKLGLRHSTETKRNISL
ncbi:HD domain protein [Dictyocaulus viviparus]|uniref:HD domain protein n=1 Tax=Dictyocaulus viviparus TaxID=29172 RepID=A0A0D8Y1T2_DICVI|nr:HD domain protein [Dictyocaulus viviparus]